MEKEIFGLFICASSGGIMKVDAIKRLLDAMSKMGYNYLEICMEDIYQIEDEPYFGYLRGSYSKQEIHEVIDYAKKYDIEVVPAIQTLAHLGRLTNLPMYSDIVDINDILLIDEPKTYVLIEKMFKTLREYFETDKINIGFDEAHLVGLGKYLDKNGYTSRIELLVKHLGKVAALAEKYGFKPHLWSDMFFRLINHGGYYGKDLHVPAEIIKKIPENCELAYWHYADFDEELYDAMFKSHLEMNKPIWFANAAGCFNGFAPFNYKTIECAKVAFRSLAKTPINKMIVTLWGDDGNECSFFSLLPSLYAMSEFHKNNYDMDSIKEGFAKTFGVNFDKFMLLDLANKTPKNPEILKTTNPCKSLFYNDCFLGWKDKALEDEGHIPYEDYADQILNVAKDMKEYRPIFENIGTLCKALSYKAELGIKTRKAYKENDKKALKSLLKEYQNAYLWAKKFHHTFEKVWLSDNKPFFFENHEARFGGLESRILFCKRRISDYLKGKIDKIEELEVDILPFSNWGLQYNLYRGLISRTGM